MGAVRTGLTMSPEASGVAPPIHDGLRLTIPAREALERAGNRVELLGATTMLPHSARPSQRGPTYHVWRVEMTGVVPRGLALCLIGQGEEQHRGLRISDEPPYPGEWMQRGAIAWYEHGEWVPCPTCRAPLVWYEAGYVPGYRICTRAPHHHVQLDDDGKSAKSS